MKFPATRRLTYETAALSNDAWSVGGYVNLPKDLSIVNRRGYASTIKGVPQTFLVRAYIYATGVDGTGMSTIPPIDFLSSVKFMTAPNNWVLKNAAVKFHAARNNMFLKSGVKMKDLGAYSKEIRYQFDANDNTWLDPVDGTGTAFAGGAWEDTTLFTESDSSGFTLKLTGTAIDEDAGNTASAINIASSYLSSRQTVAADSNLEASNVPAKFSVLNELLRSQGVSAVDDNIIEEAQDIQDEPPYDQFVTSDTNNDITESIESARAIVMGGYPYAVVEFEAPFGLFEIQATHYDSADTNNTDPLAIAIEVLDIYPMLG